MQQIYLHFFVRRSHAFHFDRENHPSGTDSFPIMWLYLSVTVLPPAFACLCHLESRTGLYVHRQDQTLLLLSAEDGAPYRYSIQDDIRSVQVTRSDRTPSGSTLSIVAYMSHA